MATVELERGVRELRDYYAGQGRAHRVATAAVVRHLDTLLAGEFDPESFSNETVHWSHRSDAPLHDFPSDAAVTRVRSVINCDQCRRELPVRERAAWR